MSLLSEQFRHRSDPIRVATWTQATDRAIALLEWMDENSPIRAILDQLRASTDVQALIDHADRRSPPSAGSLEEIAAVGLYVMEQCREGKNFQGLALSLGLGDQSSSHAQDHVDGAIRGFIEPLLDLVENAIYEIEAPPTPESILAQRLHSALSGRLALRYPQTAKVLQDTANQFEDTSESGRWQNIGNSCREALTTFSEELRQYLSDELPSEVKKADLKSLIEYLAKPTSKGRYASSVQALVNSVWDHCSSMTHRKTTSREEGLRAFVWTTLTLVDLAALEFDLEGN